MRRLHQLAPALVLLLAVLFPAQLHAQTVPPDLVQLANGGMVRGTIVENLPGDHVTIQLATGETRTFSSAEVQFAGPAASAPSSAAQELVPPAPGSGLAAPTPRPITPGVGPLPAYGVVAMPPTVHVHVEASVPDLTLQQVTGTGTAVVSTGRSFATVMVDNFAPLCTAPCDVDLPAHAYVLGISQGQGAARRADHNLFTIDHDLSLELEYESREGARIAGWITFIGGALAGAGVLLGGIAAKSDDFIDWIIAGSTVLVVSEIIGLALAFLNDHADIRVMDGTVRF